MLYVYVTSFLGYTKIKFEKFELKKNEELILFCRYLVEDNHDSFLIVDMQRRQDI